MGNPLFHPTNGREERYLLLLLNDEIILICCLRPKLKEHMQYCADHPEEISKLAKVKAQVSEVKGVMMGNIEKVWSFF